ncbi:beta-lactamase family protein [Altererythrobacter sp. SALINAS58]|nr:beta-lactamase family protein [Alteripontixanthobacter muriae]
MIYTAPEGNLRLSVVDVGAAANAAAAAASAWEIYNPEAMRKTELVTAGAPGDGWEERVNIAYETSPNERAVASATALREGGEWVVLIVEGSELVANKRSAAISLVGQSIRPAGFTPESFAGKAPNALTPERVNMLRDFVARSADILDVPGVGIALIDDGEVVWEGGVGVRELGTDKPVDENTKFMIASNTKGMATLLLSVMADEGRLRWDQPVTELYPEFRLGSDATTKSTLVRHLVCACTGLPRQDYAFILADSGAPASDTFRQLSLSEPTSDFGELYQYNNLMASAAGYLGGALAFPGMELGAAFDKAMQTRIFDPLGMDNTTFDLEVGESGNWARPHGNDIEGDVTLLSNRFNHLITPHRPAGGAWSTAADMAKYVQLELSEGLSSEGERVVSEANILKRRERGVPIGEDAWYGMGLMEREEAGVTVVTHGGTLQGYHSNFYLLPDAGIGAVILTNSDNGAAMLAPFLRRMLEVVYDGKPEAVQDIQAAAARIDKAAAAKRERLTFPGDPVVLAGLTGLYEHPEIGSILINETDNGYWMKAGFVEGPVATRVNADGSTSLITAGAGLVPVEAVVGEQSGQPTLTVRDAQHEYVYGRVR